MDFHHTSQKQRYLIVTSNAVVGEDLRELLQQDGGGDVDMRLSLDDEWGDGYSAAFFGEPAPDLMHRNRVREMSRGGTQIVLLGGPMDDGGSELASGFEILAQPFRSDDVIDLLKRFGFAG